MIPLSQIDTGLVFRRSLKTPQLKQNSSANYKILFGEAGGYFDVKHREMLYRNRPYNKLFSGFVFV